MKNNLKFDLHENSNTVLLMRTITFKVQDHEATLIRRFAKKENLSVSEYLRRRAFIHVANEPKLNRKKCPLTGITVLSSTHLPPLNTETVSELLSDFP